MQQEFFVERAFAVFDRDGDGRISLAEFLDSMRRFSRCALQYYPYSTRM